MNHPSDASNNVALQTCIGRLFTIENIVSYLGYQLREVSACLIDAEQQENSERVKAEDLALMSQMTTGEMMTMVNIEHERRVIMEAWRTCEKQKQQIIGKVKVRMNQAGPDNNLY